MLEKSNVDPKNELKRDMSLIEEEQVRPLLPFLIPVLFSRLQYVYLIIFNGFYLVFVFNTIAASAGTGLMLGVCRRWSSDYCWN